jgi:PRTRC genetic system protein B
MLQVTQAHCRNGVFNPETAAVFYSDKAGATVLRLHAISQSKDGFELAAGRPASRTALRKVLKSLLPEAMPAPVIFPEHLLAYGGDYVMWWSPPQLRSMFFACDLEGHAKAWSREKEAEAPILDTAAKVVGTCQQPGLVWAAGVNGWRVWAVKGRERPCAQHKLYRAPYFNVFLDHAVCIGNVQVQRGDLSEFDKLNRFEQAFFGSWFTHPNYGTNKRGDALVSAEGGPYGLWHRMLRDNAEHFPEETLVETHLTLSDALSGYLTGKAAHGAVWGG